MVDTSTFFMLQPPYVYFLLGAMVFVVVYVFVFKRIKSDKIEHFEGESLEDILAKRNFNRYMKTFGRKTKRGRLYSSSGAIKIRKVMMMKMKVGNMANKKDFKTEDVEYIIMMKGGILSLLPIFDKISEKEYFVIDNKSGIVEKDKYFDSWVLKPNVNMQLFGGIWICSKQGLSYLTELVYKRLYENDKEIEVNTPRRFVFYNDIYASKYTGDMIKAELEKEKYSSAVRRETGTG